MTEYDMIIIGGGISGLGVAALLSKKGYKIVLLEKESILGGRSTSFAYRGYKVDIGLHAIASYSSSGIEKLLNEVEATLELIPIKPALMHYDLDTRKYMRATSRERFGDEFKNLPPGAMGIYSYVDRLRQGLQQLMAGERKFALKYIERNDLVALTREAADVSGIPYVMESDREEIDKILG